MTTENKKWVALIVIGIIAISALVMGYKAQVRIALRAAGDINTVLVTFVKGLRAGKMNQTTSLYNFRIDENGIPQTSSSPDGFIANASFTVSTTSPARAVYTNNTGSDLMCSDESGAVYTSGTGFAQALAVVLGTTTSSTAYSANLLASTTMATTTSATATKQALDVTYAAPFILASTESITASLGDVVTNASSTYNSRRTIEFGFHCWTIGLATQ